MDFCIFVILVYIAFVLTIGLLDILHTLDDIQKQIDRLPDIGSVSWRKEKWKE